MLDVLLTLSLITFTKAILNNKSDVGLEINDCKRHDNVLPFPFKCLREYMQMIKEGSIKKIFVFRDICSL